MTNLTHPNELTKEIVTDVIIESLQRLFQTVYRKDIEIYPHSNVVELEREHGYHDGFEILELKMLIEDEFEFGLSVEDLSKFFFKLPGLYEDTSWADWDRDVVPTLTISSLADYILKHATQFSFEPISVCGSPPCAAAGYFVGMTEMVKTIRPNVERFGPSTPIRQVLGNSDLHRFWIRFGRCTRPLPDLYFTFQRLADALMICCWLFLGFGIFVDWAFLAMVWVLCVKGISFGMWLRKKVNPLPKGIVTFGDLARFQTRAAS